MYHINISPTIQSCFLWIFIDFFLCQIQKNSISDVDTKKKFILKCITNFQCIENRNQTLYIYIENTEEYYCCILNLALENPQKSVEKVGERYRESERKKDWEIERERLRDKGKEREREKERKDRGERERERERRKGWRIQKDTTTVRAAALPPDIDLRTLKSAGFSLQLSLPSLSLYLSL